MKSLFFALSLVFASTVFAAGEVGDSIPCVDLKTIGTDGQVSSKCLTGREAEDQFVILDFFQTTCGACVADLPAVNQLVREVRDKALFKYVAIDRDESRVFRHLTAHQEDIRFSVPLDSARLASNAVGLQYTPTLFVIDAANKIVYKHVGTLEQSDIADIAKLVGAQ